MKFAAVPVIVFVLAWASACTGPSEPPTVSDQAPLPIRGEVTYRERLALPAGTGLELSLVDTRLVDTPDAVIARHTVENVGAAPIPFELAVEASKVDERGSYSIGALLRDGDGRTWFVSDTQTPVVPGQVEPVVIRMIRVSRDGAKSAADAQAAAAAMAKVRYRCGDRLVDAEFGDGQVALDFDGERRLLPSAMSASGARYAQDGVEFWSKGGEATLRIGEARTDCVASDETTPWEEAQARGVRFRAIGNEPGWLVELGAGRNPSMKLMLDYGEREFAFERTRPIEGAGGYRGERDGIAAELRLTEAGCEDPMSGERFPVRADLKVADREYSGCGRYLDAPR